MRLYGELLKKITAETDSGTSSAEELFMPARCLLVFGNNGNSADNKNNGGNDGGYFEGVKGVREYTSERLVLDFKKRAIEIEGRRLIVAKYCDGDLELKGSITSLRIIETDRSSEARPKKGNVRSASEATAESVAEGGAE